VAGIEDAEHEETAPDAAAPVVSRLACSLAGKTCEFNIQPGSLLHGAYGRDTAAEKFACSYGLNPRYRDRVEKGRLKISALGPEGEVKAFELSDHPFFVATLFLPQLASQPGSPHPLLIAFLKAARR
jgi:CTP synthase (UTP-ammonia lyase)